MEVYLGWVGIAGHFLKMGEGKWRYILSRLWWVEIFCG